MRIRAHRVLGLALLSGAMCSPAMAGFITWNASVPVGNGVASSTYSLEPVGDGTSVTGLEFAVSQNRSGNASQAMNLWGEIDTDPTVRLIQDLDNFTASTWTGYYIQIFPDGLSTVTSPYNINVSVSGPGGSTAPTTINIVPGPAPLLQLSGGNVVPGDTLTVDFKFDINTTDPSGHFFYTIENTPISDTGNPNVPEPASLAILGLGACGLLTRRRK